MEAIRIASSTVARDLAAEATRTANLTTQLKQKEAELAALQNPSVVDDYFHTKCLVKIEEAA